MDNMRNYNKITVLVYVMIGKHVSSKKNVKVEAKRNARLQCLNLKTVLTIEVLIQNSSDVTLLAFIETWHSHPGFCLRHL